MSYRVTAMVTCTEKANQNFENWCSKPLGAPKKLMTTYRKDRVSVGNAALHFLTCPNVKHIN